MKSDTKKAIAWSMFDFGNSAYSLLIVTFVFPIFFKTIIAKNLPIGDLYWGLISSASVVLAGLMAPIIGAKADADGKRKKRFVFWTLVSIISTSLLYFTQPGTILKAVVIFMIANTSFTLAVFLNDSLLNQIASEKKRGKLSGIGYGLGYLGGLIAMLILRPLYENSSGISQLTTRLTFPATALYFLIFSIPAFILLKDSETKTNDSWREATKKAINQTLKTVKNLKNQKNILFFLIGFFLLNDALVTIFSFISIYATNTLELSIKTITQSYIIIQVIAIPATIILGTLSDKINPKKILISSIVGWLIVIFTLVSSTTKTGFIFASVFAGISIGSSQAVARSWFSNIIPKNQTSEFFGFNACCSKVAAILGPAVFGIISSSTGSQRIALASLSLWFIISAIFFMKVNSTKNSDKLRHLHDE
ncbi:MAG: MFS transporter [Candidatus Pacearchaeota archaeon]